jgi:hypothetical protein
MYARARVGDDGDMKIKTIEAGYAKIVSDSGHTLGYVSGEKGGSTRTGMVWHGYSASKIKVSFGFTREEAARKVIEWRQEKGLRT